MTKHDRMTVELQAVNRFLVKFLIKTLIRSLIWIIVAFVITYFFPAHTWIWYVAFAFIGIALSFALGVKIFSHIRSNTE